MILHLGKKQFEKTHKIIHKVKLDFSVCFVVQNLEKNQIQMVHEMKICLICVFFVIQHLKGNL